jgi:hypothetical protein
MSTKFVANSLMLLALAICASGHPSQNLSGIWVLDVAESDFGPSPARPTTLRVEESEHRLVIVELVTAEGGNTITVRDLALDGRANMVSTAAGIGLVWVRRAGNALKIRSLPNHDHFQGTREEWTVSDAGTELVVIRREDGGSHQRLVFRRSSATQ